MPHRNIVDASTTVVHTGPGRLNRIAINTGGIGTATIYDNTAGSGTKIGTLTPLSTASGLNPSSIEYGVYFSTGLTIVTSVTMDLTVVYDAL